MIVDLISVQRSSTSREGDRAEGARRGRPKLVEKDGDVTGLDFTGPPKPDGKLHSAALIKGDGATVKKGQTITVDYLGQVYGGKKPFDESFSKRARDVRDRHRRGHPGLGQDASSAPRSAAG